MSATVKSTYMIWCDAPSCLAHTRSSKSRADARHQASRQGWRVNVSKTSRSGGYDYCPRHHERDPEE
jgi:hypothetical protein